jgi:hypothetical protein
MPGSIVLPVVGSLVVPVALVLVVIAGAIAIHRGRLRRRHWRMLRDLNPVSEHWLADYRRTG